MLEVCFLQRTSAIHIYKTLVALSHSSLVSTCVIVIIMLLYVLFKCNTADYEAIVQTESP